MSFIGEKLLEHSRTIARMDRQAVTQRMSGKVSSDHIDFEKRQVRLELGEDPATGEKVLSPWVKIQSQSAGAHKAFVMPSGGEQMYLESEGGRVGANSIARYGAHDDENKHPASEPDEWVHNAGTSWLKIKPGRFQAIVDNVFLELVPGLATIKAGGSSMRIEPGQIEIEADLVQVWGASLKHNAKNVGDSHTNSGLPVD
jgi:phage baseplate assembly protein gpV